VAGGATTSYLAQLVTGVGEARSPLLMALPLVLIAGTVAVARRLPAALLPGAWLAWGFACLEIATLVSVDKPARFLTLLTVPAALLVAIALDSRLSPLIVPAVAVVTVLAVAPRLESGNRGANVILVSAVADRLRDLPGGPVLARDYTWWAKLNAYFPRGRLDVPRAVDPAFLDEQERARARLLHPLPDVASYRGGYVVTGPVREIGGWPDNWRDAQEAIDAGVPWTRLRAVARVGRATIWRWDP